MEDYKYVGEWIRVYGDVAIRAVRTEKGTGFEARSEGGEIKSVSSAFLVKLEHQEWEANSLARQARVKKLISELEPLDV